LDALVQASLHLEDPAERLIGQEAALLMANDSTKFPLPGAKPAAKPVQLKKVDDAALAEARLMILMEARKPQAEEVQAAWESETSNSLLLGLGCYDEDDEEAQVLAMHSAFEVSITPYCTTP
jgi:pre-mRNA-splicing factor CDC5/CEF1